MRPSSPSLALRRPRCDRVPREYAGLIKALMVRSCVTPVVLLFPEDAGIRRQCRPQEIAKG
jgi:hypothetical protein